MNESRDQRMRALREYAETLATRREIEGFVAGRAWADGVVGDEVARMQFEMAIQDEASRNWQDLRDTLWTELTQHPTFDHLLGFIKGATTVLQTVEPLSNRDWCADRE